MRTISVPISVDALRSIITISQQQEEGRVLWRVNYGASEFLNRRGGDLIIDVDPTDDSIQRVRRSQ